MLGATFFFDTAGIGPGPSRFRAEISHGPSGYRTPSSVDLLSMSA
jgi:hypothetical protein